MAFLGKSSGASIIGRAGAAAGDVSTITLSTDQGVFNVSGALVAQKVQTSNIQDGAITSVQMMQSGTLSIGATLLVTSGTLTAARFLASTSGSLASPNVIMEPNGDSGFFWDASKGIVTTVNGVERINTRATGECTLISGQAATGAILQLANNVGFSRFFLTNTTPEGAISGDPGDLCVDDTNGRIYLKASGSSNTGWTRVVDNDATATVTGARFLAGTSGSATVPNFLIEPSGNSGLYWDATQGTSITVDGTSRFNILTNGTDIGFRSTANYANILISTNAQTRTMTLYSATPEGAITANVGSTSHDGTNGRLYLKTSGSGNTGWTQVATISDPLLVHTASRFMATNSGSASDPAFIMSDTNTGLYYDSSKGVAVSVDGIDRLNIRTDSRTDLFSNASGIFGIFRLSTTTAASTFFVHSTSPEGVITGSLGNLSIDTTAGKIYIKNSGSSTPTGWSQLADQTTATTSSAGLMSAADKITFEQMKIGNASGGYRAVTGSITMDSDDNFLAVSATADITLPAAAQGRAFRIKKTTTSVITLQLVRAAAEQIEGVAATYILTDAASSALVAYYVYCDGTNWWVL